MNVLIVHAGKGFYGGAEEVICQLYDYLYSHGHGARIVSKDAPKQFLDRYARNCGSWMSFRKEVQLGIREQADIINVHNFPATLAAFPSKKPIVWMCNEPPELFTNWKRKPIEAFNRWWVRKSNMQVIVATPYDAERFERIYKVKPTVLRYGVDYDFWSQGTRTKKDKQIRLLQVGTITPYKNQKWSTQVMEILNDRGRDVTLTLAGKPEDKDYMAYLIWRGLGSLVSILGQQTKEQVRELYYTHDVLLHPVLGQGGWLVPYEAWCTDIPIITIPEFQESFMFDYVAASVAEAADMVESIMRDGPKEQAHGSWIKDSLSWEKYGEGMLKVFKEAIGE